MLTVTDERVVVAPTAFLGNPDGVEPPANAEVPVALDRSNGAELEPREAVNLGPESRRPGAGRIDPVDWPAGTADAVWTDGPASSFALADGSMLLVSNPPYGECA